MPPHDDQAADAGAARPPGSEPVAGEDEVVDDRPRLVRFGLGTRSFLVPVADVREVLVASPCTRLPGAPAAIIGVTNVRGRIVAVVDPRPVLTGSTDRDEPGHLLIVATPDGPVALHVDRVDAVVPAEPDPAETERSPLEPGRGIFVATAPIDGRSLPIIDPVALIAAVTGGPVPAPDHEPAPAR